MRVSKLEGFERGVLRTSSSWCEIERVEFEKGWVLETASDFADNG